MCEVVASWSRVIIGGDSSSTRVSGIQRHHFEASASMAQFGAWSNAPKRRKNENSYKSQNTLDNVVYHLTSIHQYFEVYGQLDQ